jgi:5-methylcytosine-specific restriction endonuclease McrA
MRARFGEKWKDGKLVRPAREIPFTLAEFRAWVLSIFRTWDEPTQCFYCTAWVTVGDFVIDHRIPASPPWWGSLDLDNLCVACGSCNRRKGRMSEDGFRKLIEFLLTLDTRDMNDALGRLATGGEGAKMMWRRKKQAQAQAPDGGLF